MKRLTLVLVLLFLAGACGGPTTRPIPSVGQIGSDLNCPSTDSGFEDGQAGWGFCYPVTWKYLERVANPVDAGPTHLDILLSITDVPCVQGSPIADATPRPTCAPNAGLFGLMVISTYDRAGAANLTGWMQTNLKPVPTGQPIQWGDATEAMQLTDGRRIALTPHHVVVMELRFNKDGLNLESLLSPRLNTWKFLY
jgi:hypothetical protein